MMRWRRSFLASASQSHGLSHHHAPSSSRQGTLGVYQETDMMSIISNWKFLHSCWLCLWCSQNWSWWVEFCFLQSYYSTTCCRSFVQQLLDFWLFSEKKKTYRNWLPHQLVVHLRLPKRLSTCCGDAPIYSSTGQEFTAGGSCTSKPQNSKAKW